MQIDVEHLYDNNDDEDEDEEVEVPPSDIEIKIKNEPEENNITDSENKIWTHRTIPLKSRMNANYNNYKNIKQTQRGRNQIRKAQRNLNISGSIYANRNAHHRRRRPFIPHQKTQNQRKYVSVVCEVFIKLETLVAKTCLKSTLKTFIHFQSL